MLGSKSKLLVAVAVLAPLCAGLAVPAGAQEEPEGQRVFTAQRCDLCHSVPTAKIEAKAKSEAMRASDLLRPEIAKADLLIEYLKQQGEVDGESHKREFKGSDEELMALVDWLLEQKTQ